jgi:hypothetical protein
MKPVLPISLSPELRSFLAFLDECSTLSALLTEHGAKQEAADLESALHDFLFSLEPPDGSESLSQADARA